jgi:hypothetical protein
MSRAKTPRVAQFGPFAVPGGQLTGQGALQPPLPVPTTDLYHVLTFPDAGLYSAGTRVVQKPYPVFAQLPGVTAFSGCPRLLYFVIDLTR